MISPRPELLAVSEAVHGSIDHAELRDCGIDPRTVLDFSASVNPFGPSPHALSAMAGVAIDRYPDRDATELRQTLSTRLNVSPECLIAGNGSSELLVWVALAFLRTDDAVVVAGPTYSEYARVATLMGARVIACDAVFETRFEIAVECMHNTLDLHRPRALFLCNPNNPTGRTTPAAVIRRWAEEFPQTLFIIDEAYAEFASVDETLVDAGAGNVVVLRSLTKAYGLAGLRLGYAVASEEIVRVLSSIRPPWSVNAAAQAAGVAALRDDAHFQRCRQQIFLGKAQLEAGLKDLGLCPMPSQAPFLLVPVADATTVRRRLLELRILVRDCSSFGLPGFIRLSPRGPEDNSICLAAITTSLV